MLDQIVFANEATRESTNELHHVTHTRPIVELGSVTTHNIKQLQIINCFVFPVRYTDAFYADIIGEHKSLSRLAYCNDIVVGGVCCRIEINDVGRKMYIMTLGVLKTYRRLGIGAAMLDFVMKAAEADGSLACVYLHVQTTNQVAIDFYTRYGFEIAGTVEDYYHNLEDSSAYLVVKSLQGPTPDTVPSAKKDSPPADKTVGGTINTTMGKQQKPVGGYRAKRRH